MTMDGDLDFFVESLNNVIKDRFDGNITKFARAVNMPIATVRSYTTGRLASSPSIDTLIRLAQAAGVPVTALYRIPGMKVGEHELYMPNMASPDDIKRQCKHMNVYDLVGAKGVITGKGLRAPNPIGYLCMPTPIQSNHEIVLKVSGYSMTPIIKSGALICVNTKNTDVVSGDIYVVADTVEGAVVRRLYVEGKDIVLAPENEKFYKATLKLSEIEILGKVIWVYQKL